MILLCQHEIHEKWTGILTPSDGAKVFSTEIQRLMHIFQTDGPVRLLKFSSDGSRLLVASGEPNQSLECWDFRSDVCVQLISNEAAWVCRPESVSLGQTTTYVVYQRSLYAFDTMTGIRTREIPRLECDTVSTSPTGINILTCRREQGWIASGVDRIGGEIWTRPPFQIQGPILFPNEHSFIQFVKEADGIQAETVSTSDGTLIASQLSEHWSTHSKLSPSRASCVVPSYRRFHRYETEDWTAPRTFPQPQLSTTGIRAIAFMSESQILYLDSSATQIKSFDFDQETMTQRWNWKIGKITSLDTCPESGLAAAGSQDGRVVVWDIA